MTARLARTGFFLGAVLLVLSPFSEIGPYWHGVTNQFFVLQDLPVLGALMALAFALRNSSRFRETLAGGVRRIADGAARRIPRATPGIVLAVAACVAVVAWAGCWLVLGNYPLSIDEFMADFGARVLVHGRLQAPIAEPWRPFAWALQPLFAAINDSAGLWTSGYLPVNSALRAIGMAAGAASLVNPVLAGVSVIAVWGVAGRLWPERRELAVAPAILLATSSQLLLGAMTAYSMTAHLAFNLVWLWLFLTGGRLGHFAALAVGFLACGLHQLIFHPLFAAPFILQLFLERRWRLGIAYAAAYAAFCLFWVVISHSLASAPGAFHASGPGAVAAGAAGTFAQSVLALLQSFDPGAIGLLAKNLIRFATWQNPLVAPLLVLGALGAWREGGTVRALLLGGVLMLATVTVLMPYQGHGWGYRYLHGFLGSACLLAVRAWDALTRATPEVERQAAWRGFYTVAVVALLLLPVRALQAHLFAAPYAAAHAAIVRTPAEVVLVDETNAWSTVDLVRNDPYLTNRPLVMRLNSISPDRLIPLCADHTLALFGTGQARRFGIRTANIADPGGDLRRAILAGRSCGGRPVAEAAPAS